jgi:hypothetical protein
MLKNAIALYESGDLAAATPLLANVVGANPQNSDAWHYLALTLLRRGLYPQLAGLLELCQQKESSALSLLYQTLFDAILAGTDGSVEGFAAWLPQNTALSVIAVFFLGCIAARRNQPELALAKLKNAALGAEQCAALFDADPRLYSIYSQGHILSDFTFVRQLSTQPWNDALSAVPSLSDRLNLDPSTRVRGEAPFIYLASCNQLYLERFGPMLVQACDDAAIHTVLHLHIVDPTDATAATIAALAEGRRHVTLRQSSEKFQRPDAGGYRSASYYACARFLRAAEIASFYDHDVLILDMDTRSLGDVAQLAQTMQTATLGYFDCGDVLPWLMCRAAVVYIRNSPAGVSFMDLLGKYIASKIEQQGFWGLDQAAIYVVSRYLTKRRDDFFSIDLSSALGVGLDAFAHPDGTDTEKQGLRSAALR